MQPSLLPNAQLTTASGWPQFWPTSGDAGNDRAVDIKVDALLNTYVLGTASRSSTGTDIVVVKYAASGTKLWEREYNGIGGNREETAAKLAIDLLGNAYAVGTSRNSDNNDDMVVVKFASSNGDILWDERLNHDPDEYFYKGVDITVNSSGDVFACGYRYPEPGGFGVIDEEYVTVRWSAPNKVGHW